MRVLIVTLLALAVVAPAAGARALDAGPVAHASAVCADHPNQAAAQRAADTVDADGDGIYCESLPCPCLKSGEDGGGAPSPTPTPDAPERDAGCRRPAGVQPISFSKTKYPNIRRHTERAIRTGWPSVLVLTRARRRRAPRPTARGRSDARGLRPRRVPGRRWAGPRAWPHTRQRPARLEGRRRLRALEREPQPRLGARDQAAAVLRRNEVQVRLLLGEGHVDESVSLGVRGGRRLAGERQPRLSGPREVTDASSRLHAA